MSVIGCPKCGDKGKVIDSRLTFGKRVQQYYIRRRRHCLDCDERWTTIEIEAGVLHTLLRLTKSGNRDVLKGKIASMRDVSRQMALEDDDCIRESERVLLNRISNVCDNIIKKWNK